MNYKGSNNIVLMDTEIVAFTIKSPKHGLRVVTVDKGCYCKLKDRRWILSYYPKINKFYVKSTKGEYLHRYIMQVEVSKIFIDHKDGDTFNNRVNNLRVCTQQQNNMNSVGSKRSSSKYKGVSFAKNISKWEAYITKDYKKINLGYYESEDHAALCYNRAAIIMHGEFARLNVIN